MDQNRTNLAPPTPKKNSNSYFAKCSNSRHQTIAAGDDNDVEMDGGSVKDGDMDACDQYLGRVLRWLLIGCLYLVSVALFIWALVDVSVDTLGGKDEIERMRWHGLFFFVFAIGLFVGVGWLVRLPLPMRRHRAFMKFVRAFWLVVLGALIGYSFGFYGGTRYIFNGRMSTFRSYRQMMHAVRIYSSEYSNHTAVVSDMSTNQPIAKP